MAESAQGIAAIEDDPKAVFITLLARELHRAGVASDQLERTITGAADALGLQVEIFALPTNITLAVGPRYRQQIVMLRMAPGRISLRRLAALNDIYERLQKHTIDLHHAVVELRTLDERLPPIRSIVRIAALAFVAVGVAVILGGGARELIVAALIGAVTGQLSVFAARSRTFDRLFEVTAAFAGTLIVAAYDHFVGPVNLYISIVAGVVVLLPGYALTLALHELANADLIAGTARLGRVLSILLALGCGALLGFAVVGNHFAGSAIRPQPVDPIYWAGAIVLMSIGLAIDLDADIRHFLWVFMACFCALVTSKVFGQLPAHQVTAFISAFVCGIVANLGARAFRVPQPVFLVPALHVLVPGSLSYESVLYVFSNNYDSALTLGVNAIIAGILIVAGLLLSQLIFPEPTLRTVQIDVKRR
ncbi:MAG: threonine/serine exporter family protein [Candidatus Eremiobacteraeota bacterium]|nr:threonine/serine exporter family protein [Candidatus Eremiobacteraeota bacterium]